jgi:hypothetical protein
VPIRAVAALAVVAALAAAGCGGSSHASSRPKGWVHPVGAYVTPDCSSAAEQAGPQYVLVSSWQKGRLTGNTGRFTGVPNCGDVIVYVDTDTPDEVQVPQLRIAAKAAPGKTAKLEFYAPAGTYDMRLKRHRVELVKIPIR